MNGGETQLPEGFHGGNEAKTDARFWLIFHVLGQTRNKSANAFSMLCLQTALLPKALKS